MRPGRLAPLCLALALAAACGSSDDAPEATMTPATTPDTTGICSRPIPALTAEPVTKERLQAAIEKMREVKAAADAGDAEAANAAFAGDTHAITHDIDPPLRSAEPLLAQDLCASIVVIELQSRANPDMQTVAEQAEIAAGLLENSGRALGLLD